MITYKPLHDCPIPIDGIEKLSYLFEKNHADHFSIPLNQLSRTFKEWLADKNLFVSFLEVFYLPANCNIKRIHSDLNEVTQYASKINFIIGGEDASMQWFKLKPTANSQLDINLAPTYTKPNVVTPYLFWTKEECELIDEATLSGVNLIHSGIPHTVFTRSKPRIAIGTVLKDSTTHQRVTCEDVYNRI